MHITTITFNLPLHEHQLPLFKQAILGIEGLEHSLYNNKIYHEEGDGQNLHRYPPIQYRVFEGLATLWGINEGGRRLEADVSSKILQEFFWQGRPQFFQLVRHFVHTDEKAEYLGEDHFMRYRLNNYLPLSNHVSGSRQTSSYDEYAAAPDFSSKITILQRIIVSHLLLFSYAVGWKLQADERIKVRIVDLKDISKAFYKKGHSEKEKCFKKFDLIVDINAKLPNGISLGNQVALGYGVLEAFV